MNSSTDTKTVTFRRFGMITIAAVYILIMVGGIVRSTGSGMGCPDWPKCFGKWVPPTHISQLPADYKEIFKVQGRTIADFDAFKTWVEYANRLVGVTIGLLIFFTLVFSVRFLKKDPVIFYFSLLAFLLVGFEGWLGAKVVSSNLAPGMITIHMVLALIIVVVLIYAVARSFDRVISFGQVERRSFVNTLLIVCTVLTFSQIVLGTQIREAVDVFAGDLHDTHRDTWLDQIGMKFYIHRSFSIAVFLLHIYFVYVLQKSTSKGALSRWGQVLLLLLAAEIASGVVMAYFAIPAMMQPVHMVLASLIFGIQFLLLLLLNPEKAFRSGVARKAAPAMHA